MSALSFLRSLDAKSLILLFWYTTLLEIPRYVIGALVTTAIVLWWRPVRAAASDLTLSVVLVGHNEQRPLRACVEALAEQTVLADGGVMQVVVVDDGSTDRMTDVARALQREGKIDTLLRLEHRSGKSAGVNLGLSACRGDIVIIADVDTTFDRDAFAEMLAYFADPSVGAVSGNIGVRNLSASLMTRVQGIEYAIGFSLGRRVADALGILSIVSGAFGAFRRNAIRAGGPTDVEVGEDADLTMKLRRAGWRIRFAPEANALTIVPETVATLIAQRLRWDRGLVTIWLRKFRGAFDPRESTFVSLTCFRSSTFWYSRSCWPWPFRAISFGFITTSAISRSPSSVRLCLAMPLLTCLRSLPLQRSDFRPLSGLCSTCLSTPSCTSRLCGRSACLPSYRKSFSEAPIGTCTYRLMSCGKWIWCDAKSQAATRVLHPPR